MALSPSIVTDGLQFNIDTLNSKSYKGPSIRNLINTMGITAGSGTGYVLTSGTEIVNIPTLGDTLVNFCNYQNTGASWCCVNWANYGNTAFFSGSTTYTYLILYRNDSGYTHPNWMYRYEYGPSGYLTESGIHSDSNRTYLGNGWYYAWNTFDTQPTTTNCTCHSFTYNYSNFNDKLSVAKVAILQGNYSGLHPRYWPEVNTVRANTQSILDTSVNNRTVEINAPSLGTFNSDYNAITLNPNFLSNQYIYAYGGNYWNAWSPNGVNGNSSLSIELVFNSSDTSGYIVSRPWNGSGQYNYTMTDGSFGLHSNASGAALGYSSICTGQTTHMVWWMNPTQYGVYKNGAVLVGATNHGLSGGGGSSGTNDFGTLFGSLYPYGSGWGGNTGFSIEGKFYVARIYNRVLSANEVSQNFNLVRRRYGI